VIALTSTTLWSTTAIFISYLTSAYGVPPLTLAFWRNFIVALALATFFAARARPLLHLERHHWRLLTVYGLLLAAFNALWTISVVLNGASVATLLAYSSPAFTAVISHYTWGERLGILKTSALVLALAGCALVSGAYDLDRWQVNPAGIVVGLGTGIMFAGYAILGKVSSLRGINPWTATLYTFGVSAAFLLLTQRYDTLFFLNQSDVGGPALSGWLILAALAIGPTIGGYGLFTVSLVHLPATTAGLIDTLEPVLTAILAFLLLGETLSLSQIIGAGMIVSGVVLVAVSDRAITPASGRAGMQRSPSP
jgi:drug/metabolite transporter (DMT)-like permease